MCYIIEFFRCVKVYHICPVFLLCLADKLHIYAKFQYDEKAMMEKIPAHPILSHSLIAASAMVTSKFGSRLRPTEDAYLSGMYVYVHGQLRNYQKTTYRFTKYLNC